MQDTEMPPTVIIVFGAGGDLTWRKLTPALYNLFLDGLLPDPFAIIGLDRKEIDDRALKERLRDGAARFSGRGKPRQDQWEAFCGHLSFLPAEFADTACCDPLNARVEEITRGWNRPYRRVYYLAVPPDVVETIAVHLGEGLPREPGRTGVVVEKPFGHDLASARRLDGILRKVFSEEQIYRIDHYLGKETVQNILAFRFANALFEPIWDRKYIDHVEITVAEDLGIGHRGAYYDKAGALRDMIQNHLLQVLCLIAMEPPVAFRADEIRNKEADVLHAVRPIPRDRLHEFVVRGQYDEGWIEGEKMRAYRDEENVDPHSATETFVALKLFVDNWRWQGVPFYLRTGKRMPVRASEVVIRFQPVPHRTFTMVSMDDWSPNMLVLDIQPDEGILLRFQAKRPGLQFRLASTDLRFSYRQAFNARSADAYETLLLDVMLGDATLFKRIDQVEAAWEVVEPILESWQAASPADFPNYRAGSWGPEAADLLIARDGGVWTAPVVGEGEKVAAGWSDDGDEEGTRPRTARARGRARRPARSKVKSDKT